MNDLRFTHDRKHHWDHRYDPSDLATGMKWTAGTIDSWILSEDGRIADIIIQLLGQDGFKSVADAITVSSRIHARMLSAIIWEMSDGRADAPHT